MEKDLSARLMKAVAGYVQRTADALRARVDTAVAEEVVKAVSDIPAPENGRDGKDGRDGRDGTDGVDGTPGRDALDLDIVSAIAEGKSYARGTFARHAGGLWRAFEQTNGMRGWECLIDGIAEIQIIQGEDPREIAIGCELASGKKAVEAFRIPTMIYRQVWRDGEYVRGDVVTWGGSAWHCNAEKTTEKPGSGSADWQLMVKEGRPGKDMREPVSRETGPVKLK